MWNVGIDKKTPLTNEYALFWDKSEGLNSP
jgi:hypothetical protein